MPTTSQIKKYREQANLTQEELARRLKVSKPTIEKWEYGTREPRLKRLREIARVLGCRPGDLV